MQSILNYQHGVHIFSEQNVSNVTWAIRV